ncbi:MAG TPA: sigma-54 dependent transcriptional regulator [Planctomycetota bacterium]|nr:sigma-54 dependent transcriptional regulator [Planctomycetota bacterium]
MSTILIAEDEQIIREELKEALADEGYRVLTAADGSAALAELKNNAVQLVITDLHMPRMDGIELIQKGREVSPDTEFIVMTAFGSIQTAIDAMRSGASDYLTKPLAMNELVVKVARLMESADLRASNKMLKRDLDRKLGTLEMIGQSPALEKIRQLIQKVAPTRTPVLITGESGTGKELIARAIHALGANKGEPFVPINCAAIPEQLLESELFGHQRGAFSGAVQDAEGLFRSARKGTLFLDEIGELPMSLQAKLLRVLEDKMIHPVGSTKQIPFEARVVAATNRNLKKEIEEKKFRDDLYFRLAVVELHSPPLRERHEDIPLLVRYFIKRFNRELNRTYAGIEEKALQRLVRAMWKGNIRELQNTIERAMIIGSEPQITEADLIPQSASVGGGADPASTTDLKEAMRQFELAHIERVLNACGGDKRKAATELGISLSSLYRNLEQDSPEAENKTSETV